MPLKLTQAVHEHHDMEEEAVFPVLQEKLDMKSNIDEHAAFLPAMMDFNNYCRKVQAGMEPYDGTKMREMLRAFGDGLAQHLLDEVSFLRALVVAAIDASHVDSHYYARQDASIRQAGTECSDPR